MAQPILTQRAQYPDRVDELRANIATAQTHQCGPTAKADHGQRARDPD